MIYDSSFFDQYGQRSHFRYAHLQDTVKRVYSMERYLPKLRFHLFMVSRLANFKLSYVI